MANIFTSENIMKYAVSTSAYCGTIETYEDIPCIAVTCARFYSSPNYIDVLANEFGEGQYYFCIYENDDGVIYNGNYLNNGIIVRYTDGSTEQHIPPQAGADIGYQKMTWVSNPNKTIAGINFRYNAGTSFYRIDSFIIPINGNVNINRAGVLTSGYLNEPYVSTSPSFGKNWASARGFIEL